MRSRFLSHQLSVSCSRGSAPSREHAAQQGAAADRPPLRGLRGRPAAGRGRGSVNDPDGLGRGRRSFLGTLTGGRQLSAGPLGRMKNHRLTLRAFAWVGGTLWVLLVGLFAAISEGIIPKSLKQLLLIALVVGPLLVFAEPLLEILFHAIGRAALLLTTFGRVRAEGFHEKLAFAWYGVAR